MNIFLLVVKDSTRKQTQKRMKGSQVGMGSTSGGGLIVTSYCQFKPKYLMRLGIFNLINNVEVKKLLNKRLSRSQKLL